MDEEPLNEATSTQAKRHEDLKLVDMEMAHGPKRTSQLSQRGRKVSSCCTGATSFLPKNSRTAKLTRTTSRNASGLRATCCNRGLWMTGAKCGRRPKSVSMTASPNASKSERMFG